MKKLVGGGVMSIVNQTVPRALRSLGYNDSEVADIIAYIDSEKTILGAPHLEKKSTSQSLLVVWVTTLFTTWGVRNDGCCAAVYFGAISKTVNMPESATVEDWSSCTLMPGSWAKSSGNLPR